MRGTLLCRLLVCTAILRTCVSCQPAPIRILVGSDFHIRGGGIQNDADHRTIKFVQNVSSSTGGGRAAAFIMGGDLISGRDGSGLSMASLLRAVDSSVPRFVIFGNHDGDDRSVDSLRLRQAEIDLKHGLSLSLMDEKNGTDGLILATVGNESVRLVGLDSGGRVHSSAFVSTYDTVSAAALGRLQSADLQSDHRCTLAFVHIPPCEVAGMIRSHEYDPQAWRGEFFETLSPSHPNTRSVWRTLMRAGASHIFSGHDHCNLGSVTTPDATFYQTGRAGHGAYRCGRSPPPQIVDMLVRPDNCQIESMSVWEDGIDSIEIRTYPAAAASPPTIAPSHKFRSSNVRKAVVGIGAGYSVAIVITVVHCVQICRSRRPVCCTDVMERNHDDCAYSMHDP